MIESRATQPDYAASDSKSSVDGPTQVGAHASGTFQLKQGVAEAIANWQAQGVTLSEILSSLADFAFEKGMQQTSDGLQAASYWAAEEERP